MVRTCPSCGVEAADVARFCAACGASLDELCRACGAVLPPGAVFCSACGTPVADEAAPLHGERKLVTILFADVTGSTSLGERLDPERFSDVLQTYFEAMREEIEAEGGTVEKFIGDAVMAAFGAPVAHEDDPARALRAATRMLRRLERVNDDLGARFDVRLQIRIGVNTGEVLAASDPRSGEALVTGDAVNAAARLQSAAEPGTIVIAERTARAVPWAHLQELGPMTLKGKTEPVHGYLLVGDVAIGQRGIPGLRAPMVGRDAEFDILRSVFARVAAERRPGLVTVYGEAGVGKSRLTAEFLASAERGEAMVTILQGRCLPYGDGIAYWPLAEILKGHAGILDSDGADLAVEKVRKIGNDLLTREVVLDPAIAVPALAFTIGLDDPAVRFDAMDPQDVREHVEVAWRAFFTAISQRQPTIVVIDDIHWADPVLLDLLETLADRVEGPALFVCPSRPELVAHRPGWGGGRRSMSTIALDPLSEDDAERLIQLLLTVDDLPVEVHRKIVERAEGNPFYLEEIIRRLIDDGSVVREGDNWRATAAIASLEIPDSVQSVLASRIDLLDPRDKRILQSAAVVGRTFWPGAVAALTGDEQGDVVASLRLLEDRELVLSRTGSSLANEREFLFKHILTRDVAYGSLSRKDRARSHRSVAAWLEDVSAERTNELAELLAYHTGTAVDLLAEIGDAADDTLRAEAHRWSLLASTQSRRRGVLGKAQRLAEDAVRFASGDLEMTDALEALAEAFFAQTRGDAAWRYFREAVEARERAEPPDGARVAYLCARACEIPQRWPGSLRGEKPAEAEVMALLDRGFDALPPGDSEERVRLLGLRAGLAYAYPQEHAAIEDLERAEAAGIEASEIALRIGSPNRASGTLDQAMGGWLGHGLYGRASRTWDLRTQVMPEVTDILEIGDYYAMGAWIASTTGRYEESLSLAEQGISLVAGKAASVEIHGRSWKALTLERLGLWDEAVTELTLIEELLEDRRDSPPYFCSPAFAAIATIHALRGDRIESDRLTDTVSRLPPDQGTHLYAPIVLLFLARGEIARAAERGRPEAWRTFSGPALEAEAEVIAARGAWDEAPAKLEEMRAYAAVSPSPTTEAAAARLEGRASLAGGAIEAGVASLTAAAAAFDALGCVVERAIAELEIAEATADRARAASAAAVFERLRIPRLRSRARAITTG